MGSELRPSLLLTESYVSFSRLVVAMARILLGGGIIPQVETQSGNVKT